jgi:hypothetical protein
MRKTSVPPDRIEQLLPMHRRWAKRFGALLLIVAIAIAVTVTNGDGPLVVVGDKGRLVIATVGYVALIGFAYFGGMSVFLWWLSLNDRRHTKGGTKAKGKGKQKGRAMPS